MDEHSACILAIVGSRDVHRNAIGLIEKVIAEHKPIMVISGGAVARRTGFALALVSIDQEAVRVANTFGIQTAEIKPTGYTWLGPGGFRDRNMKIVDACICLVRIASTTSKTYGSGWTADYAGREGKHVQRFYIDPAGEIKEGNFSGER